MITYVEAGVNRTGRLYAQLSLYRDPAMLVRLGFPVRVFTSQRDDPGLPQLVFATAADDAYVAPALDTIALIQKFFPDAPIYFYDLSVVLLQRTTQVAHSSVKFFYCLLSPLSDVDKSPAPNPMFVLKVNIKDSRK